MPAAAAAIGQPTSTASFCGCLSVDGAPYGGERRRQAGIPSDALAPILAGASAFARNRLP